MTKIWDCFSFFSESDLLELRLRHLWDYVDHFVISESDRTHQNEPRDFLLPRLLEGELEWARKKIIPICLNIQPENLPKTNFPDPKDQHLGMTCDNIGWRIENFQRNSALMGLQEAKENDIIIIGDLDEIPNYIALDSLGRYCEEFPIFRFGLTNHPYYLNLIQLENNYPSTMICNTVGKRKFLTTPQDWRMHVGVWWGAHGYHFSWMVDNIEKKIISTAHDEIRQIFTTEEIKSRAENLEDIFLRPEFTYKPFNPELDPQFPKKFLEYREKFQYLFYPVDGFNIKNKKSDENKDS